jgi:hypothetical protein
MAHYAGAFCLAQMKERTGTKAAAPEAGSPGHLPDRILEVGWLSNDRIEGRKDKGNNKTARDAFAVPVRLRPRGCRSSGDPISRVRDGFSARPERRIDTAAIRL